MKFAYALGLAAFALPAAAIAQDDPSPAAPEVEAQATDEVATEDDDSLDMNRRVCKTYKITGSRLAKRKVCRTAYEWKRHEEEVRQNAQQALNRHAAAPGNSGD